MMSDPLENAVRSIDVSYPGARWDADKLGTKQDTHRHECCPKCGSMHIELVLGGGIQCHACGIHSARASRRGPSGPRQTESRFRLLRDIGDQYRDGKPPKSVSGVSKAARNWLEWAHSSLCSRDKGLARLRFQSIRWAAYIAIAEGFQVAPKDDPAQVFPQLFVLVETLIESNRRGMPSMSTRDLAELVGLDQSQFAAGRRWARVVDGIEAIFKGWEDEVIGSQCD